MHNGIIRLDFLEPGATVTSERYIKALIKPKNRIARTKSKKKTTFFLQHDNARPRVSFETTEFATKFGSTLLPHPPYSPGLKLSDFYLFEPLEEGLRGKHFVDNNAVTDAAKKWTAIAGRDFYRRGIQTVVHRWKNALKIILGHNVCLI